MLILRCFALFALACGCVHASFDDFRRPLRQLELIPLAQRGRAPASHHTRFSIAPWATPATRVMTQPLAIGGATGAELAFVVARPGRTTLSVVLSAGLSRANVYVESGPGARTRAVSGLELESGVRFTYFRHDHGSFYADARLSFSTYAGSPPVLDTFTSGIAGFAGIELGDGGVYFFVESGLGYRMAIDRGDAGWLETGQSHGMGGLLIEILRIGVRFHL